VAAVIAQHVEDAAILHAVRVRHAADPHVSLEQLHRIDERLAAHLDGIVVGGGHAAGFLDASLEDPSAAACFAIGVYALSTRSVALLDRLHALAATLPPASRGLRSAFGWAEPAQLQGIVAEALESPQPHRRLAAIAASAMHRVDPSIVQRRRLEDADPFVRARVMRAAGELGMRELVSQLASASGDDDAACRFWASWSAVLLGDRQRALATLRAIAVEPGPHRDRAMQLALLASTPAAGQELLRSFSSDPAQRRVLIRGIGLMGDPALVPWLVEQMANDRLTRAAGEAFSLITGADLAALDLERKPPEGRETGPNDDPDDADVAMDPDDGLPWPDVDRITRWWSANSRRFIAGHRFFVGEPVTPEHCVEVLKSGYQRQRMLAAFHRSLLQPGTPLFEWRAPAWRQKRALAAL
jgi:uncharacterized protein (TIGR02270 family)